MHTTNSTHQQPLVLRPETVQSAATSDQASARSFNDVQRNTHPDPFSQTERNTHPNGIY